MYSLKQDSRKKFFFALRTTVPIIILTILLAAVIFLEQRSFVYNIAIMFLGIFASVYYIYYMFFSDVREKIIDEITGAFNRKHLFSLFPKFKNSYILLISIDNIKDINERYGIENGDRILKKFAALIDLFFKERFGVEVPIGRLKSGDFLVIIKENEEKVKKALEDFLNLYDNAFLDNIEIKLFATYTKIEESDPKRVVDHLYEELFYCKGRCKTKNEKRHKRQNITFFEEMVSRIIKERRLSLLFQPAFNVKQGRYDLVEIIVKLIDEEGQIIHPSQFIPAINRLGLENDFDIALVQKIIETIKSLELPHHIFYSFNLSPYSVRNRAFRERFFSLFEECSVPRECFVIELYESSIYKDVRYYASILERYKKEGFLLAFDNFGSCNASIEYIKTIDVDFVHFDKFFTKKIEDPKYYHLLRSWVDAFRALGIKSVIKFIDETKKIDIFKEIGVDYIQGYAIVKPMEAEELKKFFKEVDDALR